MITRINISTECYDHLQGWFVRIYRTPEDDILSETIDEFGPFTTPEEAIAAAEEELDV